MFVVDGNLDVAGDWGGCVAYGDVGGGADCKAGGPPECDEVWDVG